MISRILIKIQQSVWTSLGWTILIFILLVIPQDEIPGDDIFDITDFDKIVHAVLFGVFVWLWCFWYHGTRKGAMGFGFIVLAVLVASGYGIGMEFVQKTFTDRHFDNGDIIADVAGSISGGLIFSWLKKISPYRNRGRNQN